MNKPMRIGEFIRFLDRTVTLRMTNGEVAKVKTTFVDEDDGEIFAAVEETSAPDNLTQACAVRTFDVVDIASAELAE